jgi:hypothetical protein
VERRREGGRALRKVEFLDKAGRSRKVITRSTIPELYGEVEPKNGLIIQDLIVDTLGKHVAVVEDFWGRSGGANAYLVRYYGLDGGELWSAPLCCDIGMDFERRVVMADDGSLVALLDAGEGEQCLSGEKTYPAPPGCVGLRIFTAEGKEILRVARASEVELSPRGRFALVRAQGLPTYLVDLQSGRKQELPRPAEGGVPWLVEDSGTVRYYRGAGWSPGVKGYRYVPGKGLEKLKD